MDKTRTNLSVPVVLHRYEAHKVASLRGQTAQEIEPDSRAAEEVQALWAWLRAQLQDSTSAVVHTGAAA